MLKIINKVLHRFNRHLNAKFSRGASNTLMISYSCNDNHLSETSIFECKYCARLFKKLGEKNV